MSDRAVRIVGPVGARDLKLPADAPIEYLLPSVLDAIGADAAAAHQPESWTLARSAGNDQLARHSTLSESGIVDGATLYLTHDGRAAPTLAAPQGEGRQLEPPRYSFRQRVTMASAAFVGWNPGGNATDGQPAAGETPVDPLTPTAPLPGYLLALPPLTRLERARQVWRATDYVEQLEALVTGPRLARCATIAVVSPKGGVGKTTITALLGMLFGMLRHDRVVAIDANPDYGSLGRALVPDHRVFVDDFLTLVDSQIDTSTEVEAQLGRTRHGLLVLPAPTDPARMWGLREPEYTRVIRHLQRYAGVLLLDCGTGLQEPAATAAISAADQCILVAEADPAAASLVAEAGQLLAGAGRPITVVVNKMPATKSFLSLDRFDSVVPYASAVIVVPNERHAAGQLSTGQFDWRAAPRSWQQALRKLAVAVTADWPALGLTLRAPARPGDARHV